jgi:hypothetical protein
MEYDKAKQHERFETVLEKAVSEFSKEISPLVYDGHIYYLRLTPKAGYSLPSDFVARRDSLERRAPFDVKYYRHTEGAFFRLCNYYINLYAQHHGVQKQNGRFLSILVVGALFLIGVLATWLDLGNENTITANQRLQRPPLRGASLSRDVSPETKAATMQKISGTIILFVAFIFPTVATGLELEDLYKQQLQLEQLIKDVREEMVARTSHGGDLAAARAEINDLRCEKYFSSMKDFGRSTKAGRGSDAHQKLFYDRFDRCMELSIIFSFMQYSDRRRFFQRYPRELAGFGENPYRRIWREIKSDSPLLESIKSESVRRGNGDNFIKELDAGLSSGPEK